MNKKIERTLEAVIFSSRWIQAPLYLGLIIAGGLYAYKFVVELIHMVQHVDTSSEEVIMIGILTLIDITMVANLLVMVVVGGYATFVSKLDLHSHEDRPEWLEKIDAGTLKVKLAGALVGVSGIHLLKSFINIANKNPEHVKYEIIIHATFLISTLILAYTEKVLYSKKH